MPKVKKFAQSGHPGTYLKVGEIALMYIQAPYDGWSQKLEYTQLLNAVFLRLHWNNHPYCVIMCVVSQACIVR
jgi:hypothetical protein